MLKQIQIKMHVSNSNWALLLVCLALPVVPLKASCLMPTVYYVHPINSSEAYSPGQICITADEMEISSNTVFKFLPGQHVISEPKYFHDVKCAKIKKAEPVTSTGYGDSSNSVQITYTGSSPKAALYFRNVTHIYVSDIEAINFGIIVEEGLNVTLSNLVIDGTWIGINITNTVGANISHSFVRIEA